MEAMPSHTCLFSSSPKLWAYLRSALVLILLLVVLLILPAVLVLLLVVLLVLPVVLVLLILVVHGFLLTECSAAFQKFLLSAVWALSTH